jgi:HD-GYP domain-containing protein (c-di-GMP phosphodiesterase class II)
MQIVDIYDALASPRPYKRAYSPDEALGTIQEETDRGWRDPQIVRVFVELHQKILSKMTRVPATGDHGIENMQTSLANLRCVLSATDELPSALDPYGLRANK